MSKVSVFVDVDVDVDDVLRDIGLDDLSKYLRSGYSLDERMRLAKALLEDQTGESDADGLMPYVSEALDLLRSGRSADAELLLERVAEPKWKSAEAALLAFKGQALNRGHV